MITLWSNIQQILLDKVVSGVVFSGQCYAERRQLLFPNSPILFVEFLLDPDDPTHVYEEKSSRDSPSTYDQGMDALSSLGRVQQMEMLHGYNDMKSGLTQYLQKFAQNGKVRSTIKLL